MTGLDIHVLTLPSTKKVWLDQALASIEVARAKSGLDVNVYVVEGVKDHIGLARKKGYSLGSAEYVTHVDHDDWIHEDALAEVEKALASKPDGVTTGEYWVGEIYTPRPNDVHHLAVFKRSWLEQQPYHEYRFWADHFLVKEVEAVHIPKCLYYLRIEPDSASRKQRAMYAEEAAQESKLIRDRRLMLTEFMTTQQLAVLLDKELEDE